MLSVVMQRGAVCLPDVCAVLEDPSLRTPGGLPVGRGVFAEIYGALLRVAGEPNSFNVRL